MVLLRAGKETNIKGNQSIHQQGIQKFHTLTKYTELSEDNREKTYFAAVDIGTTTLSIEIYDRDGNYIGGSARGNSQGQLGSDVMMRLMHVSEGRGEILYRLIRDQIYGEIQQILAKESLGDTALESVMTRLRKVAVVGNTVMCHLFLGKDTTGLQGAPFRADYQGSCQITGREIGWEECGATEITVLPGIAAHVGADAAAVYAVEQLWQTDKIQLAIDLGTNAEIILNHYGEVCVCSTAAGPAFEGKGISCGCRGGDGAISGVKLIRANGNILLDIIPEKSTGMLVPKGLCGSGLVDIIAGLLENKLLYSDGYLISKQEAKEHGICDSIIKRLDTDEQGEHRFVLFDPKLDKVAGMAGERAKQVFITQQDIRNYQLAKAAIQTGIEILCRQSGIKIHEIEEYLVAGVFGAFIHPENAKLCGLFPNLSEEKIRFVGNSAGRGAVQALFDDGFVSQIEEHVRGIRHIELADQADFQQLFMQNMILCPWES